MKIWNLIFSTWDKEKNGHIYTNGGRVLIVVAEGDTLAEAKKKAYSDVDKIKCRKLFFRHDVGRKMWYNNFYTQKKL